MSRKQMHSYILVSQDENQLQQKLQELCSTYGIDIFDQAVILPTEQSSLGIKAVIKAQEKAFLKPLKSKNKAVILPQSNLLTVQAQNALLKLLEEPPVNTYIFLLAPSLDTFLPTILSRCRIIALPTPSTLSDTEAAPLEKIFNELAHQSIGASLKQAEALSKDKQEAVAFLKKLIIVGEQKLRADTASPAITDTAKTVTALQKTYQLLTKTNTNPRLALEHLFLSLSNLYTDK